MLRENRLALLTMERDKRLGVAAPQHVPTRASPERIRRRPSYSLCPLCLRVGIFGASRKAKHKGTKGPAADSLAARHYRVGFDLDQPAGIDQGRCTEEGRGRFNVLEDFAVRLPGFLPARHVGEEDSRAYDMLHVGAGLNQCALDDF